MIDENVIVQIFLVGVSAVTALIVWRKMSESNKITRTSSEELKRSNELLTLELREKYHPNILISDCRIQYESDKTNFANFTCKMVNSSRVAISNISITNYIDIRKLSLKEILPKEKEIWKTVKSYEGTLHPTFRIRDYSIRFQEENKREIWIVLWLRFDFLTNKNEEMIQLIRFLDLQYQGFDMFTHEQIQEIRKELKKQSTGL